MSNYGTFFLKAATQNIYCNLPYTLGEKKNEMISEDASHCKNNVYNETMYMHLFKYIAFNTVCKTFYISFAP
jgi:hypothetical protein